jgi:cytochrome c551/c552
MKHLSFAFLLASTVLLLAYNNRPADDPKAKPFVPDIPRTWDSLALEDYELPLATAKATPKHVSPDYYYRLPERVIYKSYPIYAPGYEPKGYLEWLRKQEPEVAFDPAKLKTELDWIKAGERVFEASQDTVGGVYTLEEVHDSAMYAYTKMPLTKEGIMPFARYVVPRKGKVMITNLSCAMCHTRVMPDGTVLKGAQGNNPDSKRVVYGFTKANLPEPAAQGFVKALMAAPWLKDDPHTLLSQQPKATILAALEAMPAGTILREGAGILFPPQIPTLIGIKDRKYLDHSGLNRHRDIGDMMRYAALNQGMNMLSSFDGFIPGTPDNKLPEPGKGQGIGMASRYSEAQLYALSKYLYALEHPANPNKPSVLSKNGERIFAEQGCVSCHTPPAFTNNTLTPVDGFEVPEAHRKKYDIFDISVGTDPDYALKTRRGTGYYKVPSLKGVWYRGPFLHDGSLATLEDVLDPNRLREDYVPTAFVGAGITHRPVHGHEFGLDLPDNDRKALLAYLRTL